MKYLNVLIPSLLVLLSSTLPLLLPIARNLEYEYATLVSYLLLLMPLVLLFTPRMVVPSPLRALGQLLFSAAITLLPAFFLFQTQLCLCSENDFRFWWMVQIFPHLLLSHGAAWLMLKGKARGLRFLSLIYCSAIFLSFLEMAWTLWSQPQKRMTHILAGFLHGAIYDNGIAVDSGILWARGSHAAIAIALLSVALLSKRLSRIVAVCALVLALGADWKASSYPSTSHGIEALTKLMPETRESKYFTLHYKTPSSPEKMELIEQIFASAEFHSLDLAKQLEAYDTHVELFIYPSRREKKLWFGGDGTDITDVKTPSVHIVAESWPHGTLRHEFVHAMASSFAFFGLGFHPNMGFTEGLATALAPSEDEISLHSGAANILRSQQIDPQKLFSPMFWGESGRRAYTVAGSLIKFLIDHYGIAKVKALYSGQSWESVFGKENGTIISDWTNFLMKNYSDRKEDIAAEALFRYPGLLYDRCPHSKSLLASSSRADLVTMRQPKDWDVERDYWTWRVDLEPGPATRLQLLRSDYAGQGASDDLLARARRERHDPIKVQEDVDAATLEFDLLIALNRPQEATTLITKLLFDLERYEIGDGTMRQLWSRRILSEMDGKTPKAWLGLLSGQIRSTPGLDGRPENNPWLLNYLYLRNHRFTDKQRGLLDSLEKRPIPFGLPTSFAVEWWKFIGIKWFELHQYEKAAIAFQNASAIAPEGSREAILLQAKEALYALSLSLGGARNVHH
ncbi:MAG: hypothetical protein EOP10_06970 [Proteobacteria bacterium]|nr:MAG: hypothetical protein EOP10_06970 [Pseudomonadota bacterium]